MDSPGVDDLWWRVEGQLDIIGERILGLPRQTDVEHPQLVHGDRPVGVVARPGW
jgi:hypothetical protein